MLNQPISSPMMKMMFGFLPLPEPPSVAVRLGAWASSTVDLASPAQQAAAGSPLLAGAAFSMADILCSVGEAPEGDALTGLDGSGPPQAARYPRQAPQANKARVWKRKFFML